jgi:subtilisin
MSVLISQELRSLGVAQVIVILKYPHAVTAAKLGGKLAGVQAGTAPEQLSKHFVFSQISQISAIASAQATEHGFATPVLQGDKAQKTKSSGTGGKRRQREQHPRLMDRGMIATAPSLVRYYPNLGVMLGTVDKEGLSALRKDPRVEEVTGIPSLSLIRPQRVAAAKLTREVSWGIESMHIPALWQQGITGAGILIGHLDTGVDGNHPVFRKKDAIAHFAEFDDLGREITPAPIAYDSQYHGTHTAATIVGRAVSGKSVGVAPGAQLASAIVIEGGNTIARVLGGMDWAVGLEVRILNMSLGFRGYWGDFLPLTQLLRARNILPVFAVGNEGPGTSRSPGNYPEALSVGAYDRQGRVAPFSSSQRLLQPTKLLVPDLLAPGVGIISAKPRGGYQVMDGSSMAAPHISGLAALLMEAKLDKTAEEVQSAIFNSCRLKANMSIDRVNRGVPDGVKALALL